MGFTNSHSGQHGGEIVEFAVTLPFIVLFFLGIVELSVGFFDQAILTNASRAAAREAIRAVPPDGNWSGFDAAAEAAAQAAAQRMFTWKGPETLGFALSEGELCEERGAVDRPRIRVTLTYPYRFNLLPNFLQGLADLTLTAETEMCVLPRNPPSP